MDSSGGSQRRTQWVSSPVQPAAQSERFSSSSLLLWAKVPNGPYAGPPSMRPAPPPPAATAASNGGRPPSQPNDLILIQQPFLGEHMLSIMLNGVAGPRQPPMVLGNYQIKDVVMSLWNNADASENDFYSKFQHISPAIDSLHREIVQFYEYMKPSRPERLVRKRAIERISAVISEKLGGVEKVLCFGSYKTELCLPTSDIDLVVFGKWISPPLSELKAILVESGIATEGNVKSLDRASVPILKLADGQTGIRFDISFNMANGTRSIGVIKEFLTEFPPLRYLVLVLKHFLLQRYLNEVFTGGIGSYLLTMMTVSFLQLHSHMNCRVRSRCNLGRLLIDFFELYGRSFNYQRVGIRVTEGGSYVPKEELISQFSMAFRGSTMLCIEDPLDRFNDIGRGSYSTAHVRVHFSNAYEVLERSVNLIDSGLLINAPSVVSILGGIIGVNNRIVEYRRYIASVFKESFERVYADSDASRPESPESCNSRQSSKDNGFESDDASQNKEETVFPASEDRSPPDGPSTTKHHVPCVGQRGDKNGPLHADAASVQHMLDSQKQQVFYFPVNYQSLPPLTAIGNKLAYANQARPERRGSPSGRYYYYRRNNSPRDQQGLFLPSRQFRNSGMFAGTHRRFNRSNCHPSRYVVSPPTGGAQRTPDRFSAAGENK